MPVTSINHYLIRTQSLEASLRFYERVLGMSKVPRPEFPFPGYWLGVGGAAQVHLAPAGIENADLYYLGTPVGAASDNSGVIDHVAFLAEDPKAFMALLKREQVSYQPRYLADAQLFQIFVKDPDGITIELNFFGIPDGLAELGEDYNEMPKVSERARES